MHYYIQKQYFGTYRFSFTTDYDSWYDAIFNDDDSLMTWARERSGENGYFLKEVKQLMGLFE